MREASRENGSSCPVPSSVLIHSQLITSVVFVRFSRFMLVVQGVLDNSCGLFKLTHQVQQSYEIDPLSGKKNKQHLDFFEFFGRVLGKAIMEQQPLPARLCLPYLKHILGAIDSCDHYCVC